jgi:hypothetical protein
MLTAPFDVDPSKISGAPLETGANGRTTPFGHNWAPYGSLTRG